MSVLDIKTIQLKKEAIEKKQAEAVAWCVDAISEFAAAATELKTPKNKADGAAEVWPILRAVTDGDFLDLQIKYGASMTTTGKTFRGGKEAPADVLAWWIAARCHYSIVVMTALFEAALLGTSWNEQTALNQDA